MRHIFANISHQLMVALRAALKCEFIRWLFQFLKLVGSSQPMTPQYKLKSNWLHWPINREAKPFRVYVVEPRKYNPVDHANIFNAALNLFVSPSSHHEEPFDSIRPFDLITFPEAFLPSNALLDVLKWLPPDLEFFGCVHVGLRPSDIEGSHLFSTSDIHALIQAMRENENIDHSDLKNVSAWIDTQNNEDYFNFGCLFTIDVKHKIRVCLHPKLVRSKFERNLLPEKHMKEAELLSLVTLLPEDKKLFSINIQPLICSDTLFLDRDSTLPRPLEAIHLEAECFGNTPPEYIDIVSVATWTPQQEEVPPEEITSREWHAWFRKSFEKVLDDSMFLRHSNSVFVLSNFEISSNGSAGGLSGTFIPTPLKRDFSHKFINVSAYGTSDNRVTWSKPIKVCPLPKNWKDRGYIAYLIPSENEKHIARMLGFTIDRLPRHCNKWQENGLSQVLLQTATNDNGKMKFSKES